MTLNKISKKTLHPIPRDPSRKNFMIWSKESTEEAHFPTTKPRRPIALSAKAGAIGATQDTVSEMIHPVTTSKNVHNVVQAFKQPSSQNQITIAKVDSQGDRLQG